MWNLVTSSLDRNPINLRCACGTCAETVKKCARLHKRTAMLSSLMPTEKLVLKSLNLKFMFLASVTAQRGQSLHIPEISHRKELPSGFEYLFVGHIDRDFKLHQGITCPPLLLGQTKFDHSHPCTLSYCLRSSRHIPLLIPSTFTFNCKY